MALYPNSRQPSPESTLREQPLDFEAEGTCLENQPDSTLEHVTMQEPKMTLDSQYSQDEVLIVDWDGPGDPANPQKYVFSLDHSGTRPD